MKNPTVLFICKANVGRSQIAEGIYNKKYGESFSTSIAGAEARKNKYIVSETGIAKTLESKFDVILKDQHIKYGSDLDVSIIAGLNTIVFLYDPTTESKVDVECKIKNLTPSSTLNPHQRQLRYVLFLIPLVLEMKI